MVETIENPVAAATPLPDHDVVPAVWSRITNLDVDRGEGSWLITRDGTRYLDYSSGIGVTNTGHAHPRVAAAIAAQAAKIIHSQQNITYHEPGLRLYDRLRTILPGGPWQAFLSNSGAEAVEAAVKLARVATGRQAMLSFRYGYHGRTAQTMALTTAKDVYRGSFEPLPGSVYHTAYPYCYRAAGGGHSPDACTCDWEEQLDLTFHQIIYPDRVAGMIIEPVLGEGGYVVPPPGFLPRLREITRQHGILLIADEVQTGFGRTGEMFAVQHWGVEPDILVMAKGIASGMPLSGILARADLMAAFKPGTHGGTYGGNVVSCAAANATLDVIEDEGLVANARERGAQFLAGLRDLAGRYPAIGDVRGLGLMVAMELIKPGVGDGRTPDPDLTKRIQAEALQRNLIVLTAGTYVNVIRIIPPLVTTADEVSTALTILDESLSPQPEHRDAVSDFDEHDHSGRRAIGLGALLLVGLVAVWLISNEVDRVSRTETIEGVRPAGALHLAGGALVFAEPDGRVVSYDIDRRRSTTLLDGLTQPIAADIGPDGTACAADRPARPDGSAWLTCTSGLRIDLGTFEVPPLGESGRDRAAWLTDIVSDGSSGWIVADSGRTALLHVDSDGTVAIHARVRQRPYFENVPLGLDRTGDRVFVALGRAGITNLAIADRNQEIKDGSWVAGDQSVSVAASEERDGPLVLVRTDADSNDFVTFPVPGDAIHPHLTEPLYRATGLAILPDHRLAIAANGQLLLVRRH